MNRPTNPSATDRPAKAVLVGGECDGVVVRMNFPLPPERLIMLVAEPARDANGDALSVETAYALSAPSAPPAMGARAVEYGLFPVAGVPVDSRVHVYIPVGYLPDVTPKES